MAEIKKTLNVTNISVLSDIGWIPIDEIHQTVQYEKYIVLFESGREVECADTHCFIRVDGREVHARDLMDGDRISSIDGYDVVFDVLPTGGYENMYDMTLPHHHLYYTNDVLSHNTNIMTNIIARQVQNNVRVGLATLEMSEDMYSQRFDANFTNLDINRIYHNASIKPQFIKGIKGIKDTVGTGALYIKEYPTGKATVADFRKWLRELFMRGMDIDIFFCDYISLMKAENNHAGDLYKDGKAISEELRALGFEFNIPVVTVAQINRAGTFLDFEALDMNSIAESFGISATADSMIIQGADVEDMMYKNELKWKCVKNRLGGRVGLIGKWYYDNRSLRIYDETEMDRWLHEAGHSGDERDLYERQVS